MTLSWRAFGWRSASEGGVNKPVTVVGAGAEPCLPEPMSEQVLEPELRKARS
jgi:hypothetical protein